MLHVKQETLDAVRSGRVMSRQIRIKHSLLGRVLQQQVEEFMVAIGGVWSNEKQAYLFKCHPHTAIGRAIFNDTIYIRP